MIKQTSSSKIEPLADEYFGFRSSDQVVLDDLSRSWIKRCPHYARRNDMCGLLVMCHTFINIGLISS